MKIIKFAALFTLLSVSSPLAQASDNDVIQKQEDDAINPIVTTSSSSNLLRGAANLAWDLLVASNGNGNQDGNDEFISEECRHDVCCDQQNKCWCCGSAQKDDADAGEGTKASFESYATKKFIQKGEEKNVNSRPQFIKKSGDGDDDDDDKNEKKGSREAEEGDDKDFYANSKFEGICEGVEEDGSSNKLFCDTLCKICVAEACECIAKHLGCAESYWEDDMKAASEKNLQVQKLGVRTAKGQATNALPQFLRTSGDYCPSGGTSCDKGL